MKYENIITTFWFNSIDNPKQYLEFFESGLKEDFPAFSYRGIPSNIEPLANRITATTKAGHTQFGMSNASLQLVTTFDENFNTDKKKCFEYAKNLAEKVFNIISENCNLEILYTAFLTKIEISNDNPMDLIKKRVFNESLANDDYEEASVMISKRIENNFYQIINLNNSKVINFKQKITPGKPNTIIFPTISMVDAILEREVLIAQIEINDKLGFNSTESYRTSHDVLNKIIELNIDAVDEELEKYN